MLSYWNVAEEVIKTSKSVAYSREKKMDFCTRAMGGRVWKILAAGFSIFSSLVEVPSPERTAFLPSLERGQCTEGMV